MYNGRFDTYYVPFPVILFDRYSWFCKNKMKEQM